MLKICFSGSFGLQLLGVLLVGGGVDLLVPNLQWLLPGIVADQLVDTDTLWPSELYCTPE